MRRQKSEELKKERRDRIKQFLKDMIAPTIFVIIVVFVLYKMATYERPADENDIPATYGFDGNTDPIVLENNFLRLDMDPETTLFTVLHKETGKVWNSNPDISIETAALQEEKNRLQSLLYITASEQTGKILDYDSFSKSINNQIYKIERKSDTEVVIHFSIGNVEKTYMIPPVAREQEFLDYVQALTDLGDTAAAKEVKNRYKKWDKDKLSKADKENFDAIAERYPLVNEEVIYTLRDGLNTVTMNKLLVAFESIGYDQAKYEEDLALDTQEKTSDKPVFNLDLCLKLDGDQLVVSVPFNSIQNPKKYPITKLTLLPFFGAGSKAEEGFMLVPEGGGGIINFNNMKTTLQAYSSRVYGWDLCLIRDSVVHDPITNFGVFGISKGDASFICIPGDGSSYATIQADISGKTNSFNYVNAVYDLYQREQFDVGSISSSDIFKYIDQLPQDEKIEQRYIFVDSGSYVDMAKEYETYLKKTYGEKYFEMKKDTEAPVNVEVIGAVDKTEQILGIPVSRPLELTSFDEAGEIADELKANGFNNVNIRYTGWCNGGVNQTVLSKAKPIGKLGGKSDLKALSSKLSGMGYKLALNGITTLALDSNIFDGFFSFTDAAKNISEERMELHKYSSVTYALREGSETFYLLHTKLIMEYAENLREAADDFGAGVAFEDIGKEIPSDFYVDDYHSRENVRKLHMELLKKYNDEGKYTVVEAGNEYAIPYVDMVVDMDLSGSNYTIIDYNIPFLELAIHGYVNYTGESLNICGDQGEELLYSAAYGAGLSFTVMKESAFAIQDTLYTHFYGCDYDKWSHNMIDIYTRYNKELGHIFNQKMTDHKYLAPGVSVTTYADGTKVYVNFNYAGYNEGGVSIPARDYKVVR